MVVASVLCALFVADAGHRGEDGIQELWLAAERVCGEEDRLAESPLMLPEDFVIPASAEWTLDLPTQACESR